MFRLTADPVFLTNRGRLARVSLASPQGKESQKCPRIEFIKIPVRITINFYLCFFIGPELILDQMGYSPDRASSGGHFYGTFGSAPL